MAKNNKLLTQNSRQHGYIKSFNAIKKIINILLWLVSIIILLWFSLSYIEIITFNINDPCHDYSSLNLFKILVNLK